MEQVCYFRLLFLGFQARVGFEPLLAGQMRFFSFRTGPVLQKTAKNKETDASNLPFSKSIPYTCTRTTH